MSTVRVVLAEMPPKRTQSRVKTLAEQAPAQTQAKTVDYALCCQKIVQKKEDVLLCTGKCNGSIHRYCGGVSVPQFEELKRTSETPTTAISATEGVPFLCLVCTQQAHKAEVHELKSAIAALKLQMQDLQVTVQKLSAADAARCNAGLPSFASAYMAQKGRHAKHQKHADQSENSGVGSGGAVGRGDSEVQGESCDGPGVTGLGKKIGRASCRERV